jgi:hypothetical protein
MLTAQSKIKKQLLVTGTVSILIFLLGLNSMLTEKIYSEFFYKYLSMTLRFISGMIAFSLGDVCYVLLILFCIYLLVNYIKNFKSNRFDKKILYLAPFQLLNFGLILYIAFKLLWGLNYSRPSVAVQLNIGDEKYSPEQLVSLGEFLIKENNTIQTERLKVQVPTQQAYTTGELEKLATAAYHNMAAKHPFFSYHQPALKKVFNTLLITKIGLEGYYNPISGEANVNMRIPAHGLPFVACHEIAHQLGVGREDEANLIGYLVALNSKDINFRYSANYSILRSVLFEIRFKSPEVYEKLIERINPETILDFKRDKAFWMKYNSDMYAYMDVALDSFLKLNNQKKGIDSYQDIVIWVYNLNKAQLKL